MKKNLVPSYLVPSSSAQCGALFGLDARIALMVFSVLAIVAGAAMVLNLNESRAKGLAAELVDTVKALENIHHDLQTDLFLSLSEPSEARAFQALHDNSVVREADNLRGRWNGPYIRAASNRHPTYGTMSLQKRGPDHSKACDTETLCFLWLVYDAVPLQIGHEVNEIIDGRSEPNAESSGRVQWSQQEDGKLMLYFRATKALVWRQGSE
jgi:hypothetical protein